MPLHVEYTLELPATADYSQDDDYLRVTLTKAEAVALLVELMGELGGIEVIQEQVSGYDGLDPEEGELYSDDDPAPTLTPDEALARIQAAAQVSQHDHMQRNPGSGIGSRNA